MSPDRVSHPGPLTYESGTLPTALRGPAGSRGRGTMTHFSLEVKMPKTHTIELSN